MKYGTLSFVTNQNYSALEFITVLFNIATFQGIVLGVIILKSPLFRSKANQYLAYGFFAISISLANYVLDDAGWYETYAWLRIIDVLDVGHLFPVFVLLFIIHQVNHPIKKSWKYFWLFLPFLSSLLSDGLYEFQVDENLGAKPYWVWGIVIFSELAEILVIVLFIPGVLLYTYNVIKLSNTTHERKWLMQLWWFETIFLISWVLTVLLHIVTAYDISATMRVIALFVTCFIHWAIYSGIFKFRLAKDQEEIKALLDKFRLGNSQPPVHEITLTATGPETKKEVLTKENTYFKRLESLCTDEHIYRDSALDREKIATQLGISAGYVSQIINTVTGENFSTYINRHRVEAVKELVLDPEFDNYSLLAIGLECGFSSKTTFYNVFKKMSGLTPNAYRKKHK